MDGEGSSSKGKSKDPILDVYGRRFDGVDGGGHDRRLTGAGRVPAANRNGLGVDGVNIIIQLQCRGQNNFPDGSGERIQFQVVRNLYLLKVANITKIQPIGVRYEINFSKKTKIGRGYLLVINQSSYDCVEL